MVVEGDTIGANDDVLAPNVGGTNMTLVNKNSSNTTNRYVYLYYLLNPTSGSNAVIVSASSAHYILAVAADYDNIQQTSEPDNSGLNANSSGAATGLTSSLTTIASNTWVIIGETSDAPTAGSGTTLRVTGSAFGEPALFDSNGALSAGSHSFTTNVGVTGRGVTHNLVSFVSEGGGGGSSSNGLLTLGVN